MYFAYVDESGTPVKKDKSSNVYVLVAVVFQEKGWDYINNQSKTLRQDIWQMVKQANEPNNPPKKFEIHLKEICNREGKFKCLKGNDRKWVDIINAICETISKFYVKIFASIIIKEEFFKQYDNVNKWAFKLLVERLNRYVLDNKHEDKVLIVMDSQDPKSDDKQRKLVEEFVLYGTGQGWEEYPEQVIETPFFVESNIHTGVQLADAVAYLIRRHTTKYIGTNPNAFFHKFSDNFIRIISSKFYRRGIKLFPSNSHIDQNFWFPFN